MQFTIRRLRIRRWRATDAEAAFTLYGDPDVMRYLGDGVVRATVESLRERFAALEAKEAEEGDQGFWAVTLSDDDTPIGAALCKVIPHSAAYGDEPEEIEIGWHLAKAHWGQGYGTEIGRAMLDFGLERYGRVVAVAFPENRASTRIMEKIGMSAQGLSDRYYDRTGIALYCAVRSG